MMIFARPAATFSLVSRRTLFVTSQRYFPPAKAAESTAKKTTVKKEKTPAKRGRNPVEKQPKQEKQKLRVPASLKPPKRAPSPYMLFYTSWIKSQSKPGTMEGYQELCKRAAEIWNGYSMAEKQPFYDEKEARDVRAKQERDEYFRKTSPSDLRQLNAIRKAQGKPKIRSPKPSRPPSPFLLFSMEFRHSPEGKAINEASSVKDRVTRVALAAGERWKSMSEEEKAPYFESYKKARAEFDADQVQS